MNNILCTGSIIYMHRIPKNQDSRCCNLLAFKAEKLGK